MKQFKLTTTLCISASLCSSLIFAQPTTYKDMPAATAISHNWTGFYAGLNMGGVQHTMNITDTQATTFNATIQQVAIPQLTGGFQVGYRRQLNMALASGVYGAEFSTDFANASFNKQYGSPFALYQLSSQNKLKTVSLLQAIGGIAVDRTLLFIAAGMSWSNIKGTTTNTSGIPFFNSFSVNKKVLGTALSGGIEYAFTEKFSARFKVDAITPNVYSTYDTNGNSYQVTNTIVQGTLGVNYTFG